MWTPPKVAPELVAGRREFEAEIKERMVRQTLLHVKGVLDEFNYELKRIDPKLELVRAGEDTRGTPMKAGYYHVIRWNEGAPPSVMTVEGDHGEFVEPSSRVFEKLRQNDLWDPQNQRLLRQRNRLAEVAEEKRKVREREERQAEIMERYNAAHRTFVSMDRSTPWAQNWAGTRRRG